LRIIDVRTKSSYLQVLQRTFYISWIKKECVMDKDWKVIPGWGGSGGGGPFAGSLGKYQIVKPDGAILSAYFYGGGATIGGPASFTFSDSETPSYGGKIIWRPGIVDKEYSLKYPSDGMIFSVGAAPRFMLQYFGIPYDANSVSGGYLLILAFGVSSAPLSMINPAAWASEMAAATAIGLDTKYQTNGALLGTFAVAYTAVLTAVKGVDIGGLTHLSGRWTFL
jgi:hypothetical protein